MSIIEEHYTKISLWCRPLSRNIYSFDEVGKVRLHPRSDGTKTLLAEVREKERKAAASSKVLMQERRAEDRVHAEYTNALSEFSPAYAGFSKSEIEDSIEAEFEENDGQEAAENPRRLKRFRNRVATKVANALFDYSEIEQQQIEDEINELVNSDGYYDEVEPEDANEEYEEEKPVNTALIVLIGVLVLFLVASALYFHFVF